MNNAKSLEDKISEMEKRKKPDELLLKHWKRELKLLKNK
jgi:hypothetical protein